MPRTSRRNAECDVNETRYSVEERCRRGIYRIRSVRTRLRRNRIPLQAQNKRNLAESHKVGGGTPNPKAQPSSTDIDRPSWNVTDIVETVKCVLKVRVTIAPPSQRMPIIVRPSILQIDCPPRLKFPQNAVLLAQTDRSFNKASTAALSSASPPKSVFGSGEKPMSVCAAACCC